MEKPITSDEIELPSTIFRELLYDELLKSIRFMKEDYPPDLMARIRDEIKFKNLEELKKQLTKDRETVIKLLKK